MPNSTAAPARPRPWWLALFAVAAFAVAVPVPRVPRPALAAPAEDAVGEALLASGKQALGKRNYDEAVAFFEKALEESPDLIEAAYWRGQAHEKAKRTRLALESYREYLALFADKDSVGTAGKEEAALARKAEKAVEKLGAAERELDALNRAFVASLLAFASSHAGEHPSVARDALGKLLRIDPDNAEAADLLERLGGGKDDDVPVGKPPPGPFVRLAKGEWQDFIADKTLGTNNATYTGKTMVVDRKGGSVMRPTERVRTGERFVMEADFRVLEPHEATWLVGVVVGFDKKGEFYTAFAQRGQVVLNHADAQKGPLEDVDVHPMKPLDLSRWHRLGVRVEGRAIVVWFDGAVAARTEVPDAATLLGDAGLFVQKCKVEFRLLRVAPLE